MLSCMDCECLTFCPEESDDGHLNYKLRDNRCQIAIRGWKFIVSDV
jgi:hypothetical protein